MSRLRYNTDDILRYFTPYAELVWSGVNFFSYSISGHVILLLHSEG